MRIVAASDIHGDCNALTTIGNIALRENADLILLAGDICSNSRYRRFVDLLPELADHGNCPVVFTPGNHDFWKADSWRPQARLTDNIVRTKKDVTCLIDECVCFEGVKIYGTPWTIKYGDWNWMKEESELLFNIPTDTQILLSHCPPYGYGDKTKFGNLGSKDLLKSIQALQNLKLAIFGHAHRQSGYYQRLGNVDLYNVACRDKDHILNYDGIKCIDYE